MCACVRAFLQHDIQIVTMLFRWSPIGDDHDDDGDDDED